MCGGLTYHITPAIDRSEEVITQGERLEREPWKEIDARRNVRVGNKDLCVPCGALRKWDTVLR